MIDFDDVAEKGDEKLNAMNEEHFQPLISFLQRVPGIEKTISCSDSQKLWWVKFSIRLDHPLAWHVVQELGHVLNYLSLQDRLPTIFMPVSPPPYMNGGPEEFLSWIIECKDESFTPNTCAQWLQGRLPSPVEDERAWWGEDDDSQ
ncbi:MAG: hypothetical protein AB7H80_16695 [Candidatus Kapaibacterium sp.]